MASKPKEGDMIRDVLFPDDGMPRGGRKVGKLQTGHFRKMEGKAYTAFQEKDAKAIAAKARVKLTASAPSLGNTGKSFGDTGPLEVTRGNYPGATYSPNKPKYFLQRGFGLGDRTDILKAFGANSDCPTGPGSYNVHEVGMIKWKKEEGNSHPAQCAVTNHKSCTLCSFGKPKSSNGPAMPPLARAPGPGHYGMPDLWDPNWQRYPTMGRSFVRKLPPPGESRFGGLAAQELENATGAMTFMQ